MTGSAPPGPEGLAERDDLLGEAARHQVRGMVRPLVPVPVECEGDGSTGGLDVELVDRRPTSRDAKIEVRVADPSAPLSKDPAYVDGPQKSGILRWDLKVPAAARGDAAMPVTWSVQATYPKDVQVTPLPD